MSFSFKHVLLCVAAMCCALSPKAVLPEGNIDRTMVMLSEDMKVLQQNITTDLQRFDDKLKEFRQEMHVLNDNCDEAGLVLYTQDERYLYGALQATQNMRNVIDRIQKLKKDLARLDDAISTVSLRYDKLSDFLEKLKSRNLTADGREALMASQTMTDSLNRCLSRSINELKADSIAYHNLLAKTDSLGKYNDKVLQQLHSRIFTTGNETLPYIFSHFSNCWNDFKHDLAWRFFTGQSDSDAWKSAEDRMFDLFDTFTYIAIIVAICFYVVTRFKRFSPRWVGKKGAYHALLIGLSIKILGFFISRIILGSSYQIDMTLTLDSEFYLLILFVTASITLRIDKGGFFRSLVSYSPMFFTVWLLIEYREDLVALSTVTFTAPFIFLLAAIGQAVALHMNRSRLENIDMRICQGNLAITSICLALTYFGYTILATMVYLIWTGIVICIMLLASMKEYLRHRQVKNDGIVRMTLRELVYPLAFPTALLLSMSWGAHIYNLTYWFRDLLSTPFIDMPDKIGIISTSKLIFIYALGICVNYALDLTRMLLKRNPEYRQGKVAVAITVGNIIAWFLYIASALIILGVNRGGLLAAIGGASVGIGFALKDTFENLFCGVSLMAGRVRPGDILEYEGERGKVLDVGISSTSMVTEDGPIMAMPNRQLFEKNFKNMTRNDGVELRHITFDISADNDVDFVREIILDSFHGIDGVAQQRTHVVVIRNFGCGILRVELKVWIDADKYQVAEPAVREAVFKTFRDNGIEAATFLQQIDSDASSAMMKRNSII